jgi:hypothetical protein
MLFFREHDWLLVPGGSRLTVDIRLEHRSPEDVDWALEAHFLAGGARWRRVRQEARPALEMRVCFFEPKVRHWTELERVSFWDLVRRERIISEAGWLETRYRPGPGENPKDSTLTDHIWRVAKREGRFFTVELAAFADGRDVFQQLAGIAVLPDGEEAPMEPDEEFWKANAQLYMVENIPLGVVRVEVPRNAEDAEAHACKRARSLLGLEAPEWAQVRDFAIPGDPFKDTGVDLHAELHFHGCYEG